MWLWIVVVCWLGLGFLSRCMAKGYFVSRFGKWSVIHEVYYGIGAITWGALSFLWIFPSWLGKGKHRKIRL